MRGPRDVKAVVSTGTVVGFGFTAGAGGSVTWARATGAGFGELAGLARFAGRQLAEDLRWRFSFKNRWQNFITETSDVVMPF
jgi:hypothetical protein